MQSDIIDIARAVHYEMSYLNHVSKSDVLSESSFKYPAVEWLERKGGNTKAYFEKAHPVFLKRFVDIRWETNNIPCYLEMKYVKEETMGISEQQRYFNDLLRLAHILNNQTNAKCYFLACGLTSNWMPCFQKMGMKPSSGPVPIETYTNKVEKPQKRAEGIYDKWFSFDDSEAVRNINTADYEKFYEEFVKKYKFRVDKGDHPVNLNFCTTLRWISEVDSFLSSCATAVWEITLKA